MRTSGRRAVPGPSAGRVFPYLKLIDGVVTEQITNSARLVYMEQLKDEGM